MRWFICCLVVDACSQHWLCRFVEPQNAEQIDVTSTMPKHRLKQNAYLRRAGQSAEPCVCPRECADILCAFPQGGFRGGTVFFIVSSSPRSLFGSQGRHSTVRKKTHAPTAPTLPTSRPITAKNALQLRQPRPGTLGARNKQRKTKFEQKALKCEGTLLIQASLTFGNR